MTASEDGPTLEQLQLLGVDLADTLEQHATKHGLARLTIADAVEGFCAGLSVAAGESRAAYIERAGKLHDSIAQALPTVGQS